MPIRSPKFSPPSSGISFDRSFDVTLDAVPLGDRVSSVQGRPKPRQQRGWIQVQMQEKFRLDSSYLVDVERGWANDQMMSRNF